MDPAQVNTACGACCTKLVNFGVRFGRTVVLEDINLHMHCGELTALIGPNGAGKSTLLKGMLGEIPHSGELHFLPFGRHEDQRPPRLGYVPQKLEVDPLSPLSVLDLFATATSTWPLWLGCGRAVIATATKALAEVDAADLLHCRVGSLSGGELQRVLLALALTPIPDILLLDEPVSGVDQAGIGLFYQMISRLRRDYDLSILLISHDLRAVAQIADRIVFLNRRVLCDGAPRQVLADAVVKENLGFDVATLGADAFAPPPLKHAAGRGETSGNREARP